jgi:pyridoxine/pyridoxamine 5'-phosphate oxidase
MRETADDLERLQRLLDDSVERASSFLRSSFQLPERSLSAEELVARLDGRLTVALATVTARGEPRVAPINAFFLRGAFYVPTVAESARARHLAHRPAASLTYFERTSLAVIAHGIVEIIGAEHPAFDALDQTQVALGGESPREWQGRAVYLHLAASSLFTYAAL